MNRSIEGQHTASIKPSTVLPNSTSWGHRQALDPDTSISYPEYLVCSVNDVDMELEDLEGKRSRLQADKDAHAAKVNRARCVLLCRFRVQSFRTHRWGPRNGVLASAVDSCVEGRYIRVGKWRNSTEMGLQDSIGSVCEMC